MQYNGSWVVSNCSCESGGSLHETDRPGASMTFTSAFQQGSHVGLVFATGPSRGKAVLYVDDVNVAAIDAHAGSAKDRVVVWQSKTVAGTHRFKVVDASGAGRRTTRRGRRC